MTSNFGGILPVIAIALTGLGVYQILDYASSRLGQTISINGECEMKRKRRRGRRGRNRGRGMKSCTTANSDDSSAVRYLSDGTDDIIWQETQANSENLSTNAQAISGRLIHCRISTETLDIEKLCEIVKCPLAGAIVTFSGTTRNISNDATVSHLEYEAYKSMAEKELYKICTEAQEQWPDIVNMAVEHKVGNCPVLDTSVLIAVSSGHRVAAFEGSRYIIDTIKSRLPVWKKEVYISDKNDKWKQNLEFHDERK